jgi:uncharacterized protein (UPF0548 family)
MITFRPPAAAAVQQLIEAERSAPLTYAPAEMTRGEAPPSGYRADRRRQRLGEGAAAFERAVAALRAWAMFRQSWIRIYGGDAPYVGQVVAVSARVGPAWWTNTCRVVYLIDDPAPTRRVGFAYGTLPAHAERGEERFLVEMLPGGDVWYDLLAYSRPRHLAARAGYPFTRWLQRRFGAGSAAAMARAVAVTYLAR